MRLYKRLLWGLVLLLALSCTRTEIVEVLVPTDPKPQNGDAPPVDNAIFPTVGSTSFLTASEYSEVPNQSRQGYAPSVGSAGVLTDSAESADTNNGTVNAPTMPTPDTTREIVEADIFKVDGDYLFLLNGYRGLIIVSIADVNKPKIVGRLPFQGVPVEMYVEKGRAFVIMSDFFSYWQYDADADPLGFHGSQLLVVDVNDKVNPKLLGSMPVDGEVTDTRLVGEILYTVSKRNSAYWRYNTYDWEDTTWVASLNIADPGKIKAVDRVEFTGTSTLIHVAHHAIFVAAVDPNYYLADSTYERETLVTYVDISDASGKVQKRDSIYIPGTIPDRFKMDFHGKALRVFSQRNRAEAQISLTTVDLTYPDDLKIAGSLDITAKWSSLQATRFDGDHAYAVIRVYPYYNNYKSFLRAYDLADPSKPTEVGSVEIPGYVNQLVAKGERLIGLGQIYEYSGTNYQSRTGLYLFNVTDPSKPSVQSLVKLGTKYSSTSAQYDDKALRIVDDLGLVLLPLNWYVDAEKKYHTGTQIVSWKDDVLAERGRVDHFGSVQRAVSAKGRLLAISDNQLQVINIDDLDNPQLLTSLYLQRTVYSLFNVQGYAVQIVAVAGESVPHVEVLEFSKDDDTPALAKLELPYSGAPLVFRDGDVIRLLGYEPNKGQVFRNLDLTDPLQPKLRGELVITDEINKFYTQGLSFYSYYWSPYAGLPLNNRYFPVTARTIVEDEKGRRNYQNELRIVDLSDIDNPRVANGKVPLPKFAFVNRVTHGTMLFSTHVEDAFDSKQEKMGFHVRSYVDRIDLSDPDKIEMLPKVSIPGTLVDVSDDGKVIYTIDYQWDGFGRRRNSLNVLELIGDQAHLKAVIPVGDQIHRALFRDHTVYLSTHKYPWWGMKDDTVESRQPYTHLEVFKFTEDGRLDTKVQANLHGYHFDLLDVREKVAFFASTYPYGVISVNLQGAEPKIMTSSRTVGYISRMVIHEGFMYMPLGSYGVRRTSLASTDSN